ncbi:MAG: DUF4395 domain-containing protein [Mycobacteriales bacterium]
MIDPRGPRFAAWVTTAVLAVVLLTGSAPLLAAQAAVFALGASGHHPYALFWKRFLKRGTPPAEPEDAAPLRFAQLVGLVFALVGVVALALGATTVGLLATAAALSAALLNAAFGLCLGCELYLLVTRLKTKRTTHREAHREEGATA